MGFCVCAFVRFHVFTFSHHFRVFTLVAKKNLGGFQVFGFFSTKVSNEKIMRNTKTQKFGVMYNRPKGGKMCLHLEMASLS